jgi:hypothetical protein
VCTIYELREPQHEELVQSIREAMAAAIPFGSNFLIASSGDSRLVEVADESAWHFPQTTERDYAGNLVGDDAAIALVEDLRANGAAYLVVPRTTFWWLADYAGLTRHLDSKYRRLVSDQRCFIYDLAIQSPGPSVRSGIRRRRFDRRKDA